jgi:hypothetical protein
MEELAFLDCAINLISVERSCFNFYHLYHAMQVPTEQQLLCPGVAAMRCTVTLAPEPHRFGSLPKKLQRTRYLRTRPRQKVKAELQSQG